MSRLHPARTSPPSLEPGPGDHRGIVGAEIHRRRDEAEAVCVAESPPAWRGSPCWPPRRRRRRKRRALARPRPGISRWPAPMRSRSVSATAAWNEAQMSAHVLVGQRLERGCRLPHRGLQAGKGEIQPCLALHRPRKGEALRVAALPPPLHRRSARIGQAEQLRRLVEGLAERVVDRRAPALVVADAACTSRSCVWPPETSSIR